MSDSGKEQDLLEASRQWSQAMAGVAERSREMIGEYLARTESRNQPQTPNPPDPLNIAGAFMEMGRAMLQNPQALADAQQKYWENQMALWQNTARRMLGEEVSPAIEPMAGDRRFADESWQDNPLFDHIKQSYLLTARWLQDTAQEAEGLSDEDARKVQFYTRQFADAMAPTNFLATNPAALRETLDSKGENLIKGLENLLGDLERGKGQLKISMTDQDAFEIGKNVATTPGNVVYQNDLMQLLQYEPATRDCYKAPLLIIPPWINKFYILDLKEKNSFIKWAVSQGHTVFVISWINPDGQLRDKGFEDYMLEGPLAALEAIDQATGEKQVNAIGYCLGGTLLSATLAYMAEKKDKRIKSATFFTTMIDFDEAGELSIFVDEEQLAALEQQMAEKGYLDGAEMATTFNMLRANDLIWSFVVNNYLMGKQPFPFDLLYWNSDSTRMPSKMHSFYLRNMYLENRLIRPGGITLDGVAIDLGKVEVPAFVLSTREDHIAPWQATYAAVNTYSGPVKFVLAGSGHIAGVINPPSDKMKYGYWLNSENPEEPDQWLEDARQSPGSWWPEWQKWIQRKAGKKVPARIPGDGKLAVLEDAPGSYVRVRA